MPPFPSPMGRGKEWIGAQRSFPFRHPEFELVILTPNPLS